MRRCWRVCTKQPGPCGELQSGGITGRSELLRSAQGILWPMKRWLLLLLTLLTAFDLVTGCATLDEKQRGWIFQPGPQLVARRRSGPGHERRLDRLQLQGNWPGGEAARPVAGAPDWRASPRRPCCCTCTARAGTWWSSAFRTRRMHELGFSVLGMDYRGFGQSTQELPSETMAYEDARAAWDWLGQQYPGRPRYIFGHSLGGAIAVELGGPGGRRAPAWWSKAPSPRSPTWSAASSGAGCPWAR